MRITTFALFLSVTGCAPVIQGFQEGTTSVSNGQPTLAFRESFSGATLADAAPATPPPPPTAALPAMTPPPAYEVTLKRGAPQPNAYALIVCIEKYRDVPSPTGARGDAERFAKLAEVSLGIPKDHIVLDLDQNAGKSDIEKHFAWLTANVPPDGRIYFFFAGHGAPEPTKGTAYLLPYDGDPKFLPSTGLKVDDVMATLRRTKAKEVVSFVDACFSGAGGRSVLAEGTRALVKVIDPTVAAAATGPKVALFTSAAANETSGPFPGQPVGLFTQMVIRGLGAGEADFDGDSNISLDELAQWVPPRVAREAKKDNRDQNPSLRLGTGFGDAKKVWISSGLAQ